MKAEEEGTNTLVRQTGGDECEVRLEVTMMVTLGHLVVPGLSGGLPGHSCPGQLGKRASNCW